MQKTCLAKPECIRFEIASKFKKQCAKEKKEYKEKNKKLSDYELEARAEFQKWIRIRDKEQPCISCGIKVAQKWDAGHYLKAELFSGLIFNEMNVHKQCVFCNHHKSGNELEYRDGLIKRYGAEYEQHLQDIKNLNRVKKYSKEELISIKNKYKEMIKNNVF